METAQLVTQARNGDQQAWNALVDEFNGLLWSIARGFRLDQADAHDAVQMTWLRLVENLDRIEDTERIAGWLATTARRECLAILRRRGRETPTPVEITIQTRPDPGAPVDAGLLLDERDRALWRAVALLSDACQRLLRVLMSTPPPAYRDVADALGISVGTIGPTRQRCLNSLRQLLSSDEALTDPVWG